MQPHLEEAWRALQLADRDITAFHILRQDAAAWVTDIRRWAENQVRAAEENE